MLFYDTVVLVLTVMRTYTTTSDRTVARRATTAVHVPTLILRDGKRPFLPTPSMCFLTINIYRRPVFCVRSSLL